jgi:hypothetical protein
MQSATESLEYLLETDDEFGRLKGEVEGLDYLIKMAEARGYLGASGTQDQRKSQARISEEYERLVLEHNDRVIELHTIGAKRKTAELVIEVWRSQSANRRVGNV